MGCVSSQLRAVASPRMSGVPTIGEPCPRNIPKIEERSLTDQRLGEGKSGSAPSLLSSFVTSPPVFPGTQKLEGEHARTEKPLHKGAHSSSPIPTAAALSPLPDGPTDLESFSISALISSLDLHRVEEILPRRSRLRMSGRSRLQPVCRPDERLWRLQRSNSEADILSEPSLSPSPRPQRAGVGGLVSEQASSRCAGSTEEQELTMAEMAALLREVELEKFPWSEVEEKEEHAEVFTRDDFTEFKEERHRPKPEDVEEEAGGCSPVVPEDLLSIRRRFKLSQFKNKKSARGKVEERQVSMSAVSEESLCVRCDLDPHVAEEGAGLCSMATPETASTAHRGSSQDCRGKPRSPETSVRRGAVTSRAPVDDFIHGVEVLERTPVLREDFSCFRSVSTIRGPRERFTTREFPQHLPGASAPSQERLKEDHRGDQVNPAALGYSTVRPPPSARGVRQRVDTSEQGNSNMVPRVVVLTARSRRRSSPRVVPIESYEDFKGTLEERGSFSDSDSDSSAYSEHDFYEKHFEGRAYVEDEGLLMEDGNSSLEPRLRGVPPLNLAHVAVQEV